MDYGLVHGVKASCNCLTQAFQASQNQRRICQVCVSNKSNKLATASLLQHVDMHAQRFDPWVQHSARSHPKSTGTNHTHKGCPSLSCTNSTQGHKEGHKMFQKDWRKKKTRHVRYLVILVPVKQINTRLLRFALSWSLKSLPGHIILSQNGPQQLGQLEATECYLVIVLRLTWTDTNYSKKWARENRGATTEHGTTGGAVCTNFMNWQTGIWKCLSNVYN